MRQAPAQTSAWFETIRQDLPPGAKVITMGAVPAGIIDLFRTSGCSVLPAAESGSETTPLPPADIALCWLHGENALLSDVEARLRGLLLSGIPRLWVSVICSAAADHWLARSLAGISSAASRLRGGGPGPLRNDNSEVNIKDMLSRLGLLPRMLTVSNAADGSIEFSFHAARALSPPLLEFGSCNVGDGHCVIDGRSYKINAGKWAFYIPELEFKILYAENWNCSCVSPSAPKLAELQSRADAEPRGRYTVADWKAALTKPVTRRVAENYVAGTRLAFHGLGPAIKGCLLVHRFSLHGHYSGGGAAGYSISNLMAYRKKPDTTEAEMNAAGVQPDKVRSALRQQIRGYVSDLNSVVGVMPVNAGADVEKIERLFADARQNAATGIKNG